MFSTLTGRSPVEPAHRLHEWKRLLEQAKVPERRLHDARHAQRPAALADPGRVVIAIMGGPTRPRLPLPASRRFHPMGRGHQRRKTATAASRPGASDDD